MPIPFPTTEVPGIPAIPAKTVTAGWLRRLSVSAFDAPDPSNARDRIEIEVCGFVPETGEIVHELTTTVELPLWEAVQAVPEAAAAMAAVLAAVPALTAYAVEKAEKLKAEKLKAEKLKAETLKP